MKTKLSLDFKVGEKVHVPELKINGIVINILIDNDGVQYKVRYFSGLDPKEVYFYPWELTSGEKNTRVGF